MRKKSANVGDPATPRQGKMIVHHYKKDSGCSTHHVDGVYGGLTPNGYLHMDFFLERFPTPKMVEVDFSDPADPRLTKKEGKEGILRDVQCGIMMDINAAQKINAWLGQKITEFYDRFKPLDTQRGGGPDE